MGNGEGESKEKSIVFWFTISLAQLQVQLELGGGQLQPDHWLSDHLPKVTGLASHHSYVIIIITTSTDVFFEINCVCGVFLF